MPHPVFGGVRSGGGIKEMGKTKKKLIPGYTLPVKKCMDCGGNMSPIAWLDDTEHIWNQFGFSCKKCGDSEYSTRHDWPFLTKKAHIRSFELLGFEVRRI